MSDKPKPQLDDKEHLPHEVRYSLKPLTPEEALKKALEAKPEPKRKPRHGQESRQAKG